MSFGITVDDGSEILSKFVSETNENTVELYDWQRRAVNYFKEHKKTILEVCTGAGKTTCAIEMIKEYFKEVPEGYILVVVPKNVILEKTWYKELYDAGFSLKDIGVYYGFTKEYAKITLTNMQNLKNVTLELFGMMILDECHNYSTPRLLKILEETNDNYITHLLGLSATMENKDNKHWKLLELFDYNVFKYSPKQGLEEGVLNSFNFTDISIDMDEESYNIYLKLTEKINLIMLLGKGYGAIMRSNSPRKMQMLKLMTERKELFSNYHRKFDVVKKIVERHKKDKIIIFNNFNKQTNSCYWHLLECGVKARIYHSGLSREKREETLIDFKNDVFSVLLTSRALDEGFNLPSIDVGIIMAGETGKKQLIQRLGRILRRKDHSSELYQMYCKGTVEEEHALERAKLFKELSTKYYQYYYDGVKLI